MGWVTGFEPATSRSTVWKFNSILLVCFVLSLTLPHGFTWFSELNVAKLLPSISDAKKCDPWCSLISPLTFRLGVPLGFLDNATPIASKSSPARAVLDGGATSSNRFGDSSRTSLGLLSATSLLTGLGTSEGWRRILRWVLDFPQRRRIQ